jgi:hypothetical protein
MGFSLRQCPYLSKLITAWQAENNTHFIKNEMTHAGLGGKVFPY